jgi:hypothetical protein
LEGYARLLPGDDGLVGKSDDAANKLAAAIKEKERMEIPAIYADRFHSIYWKDHVRLSIGETGISNSEYWRFSIVMETRSVRRLIKQLQSVLADMERPDDEEEE